MNPSTVSVAPQSSAPVVADATTRWVLDAAHSEVGFRVRHMMLSWTRGKFDRFEGTLVLDERDPSRSHVEVSIDTASVNTNTVDRDNHLRSADFFESDKFPKMTFVSTKVEPQASGALKVQGELQIRGTKKPVTLDVEALSPAMKDPWGGTRRGTRATTKLNRKDFGLTWNAALELGGVLVGEEVEISLEIELIRK
ncbi:MAG: YceI family protein [Myxococcaceae bacterium]